ncbi:hypothetical protein ICM05_07190 [Leucobacter sp. cx-42]|uniref:LPO_1073/Vpar_1526 family protein n=1 Tax=unclassified Leucobacter TaxID=2621730 RepID=UPI00165D800B|nr:MULTISPECIES: LPO_1073/Vpar_1526 family protein [unclassified Leucobacter]MBC9954432.1 hypothetical protein [Leucobacter sp. cx-42]
MSKRSQQQEAGPGSANYQAGKDMHFHGLTVNEAREVALDVFRSNAIELAGVAQSLALQRAETLTSEFLAKLEAENPERVHQLADPDVQTVVFEAQKEFARSGEADLRTALVDLLASRVNEDQRNLRTLALNEAISSASKLTEQQRRAIAWVFYLRYVRLLDVKTAESLYSILRRNVSDIGVDIPPGHADYQHIEYVGAGTLSISSKSFGKAISSGNEGLYTRGFSESEIEPEFLSELKSRDLVTPAMRDHARTQLVLLTDQGLEKIAAELGLSIQIQDLKRILALGQMTESEIADEVVEHVPALAPLRNIWEDERNGINRMTLTSVGLALGHAYWTRLTGDPAPLSIWLP